MRKIKIPETESYFGMNTRTTLYQLWEKNFLNESNKFISATYLVPGDLGREFVDEEGEKWKILGQMEGKDMPCEKISTGEVFVWDKWRVSALVYPEKHAKPFKKVEVAPVKPKRKKKTEEVVKPNTQLNLFNSDSNGI